MSVTDFWDEIGFAQRNMASVGLTRLMSSLLFDVSPVDPVTYGLVSLVLVVHWE